MCGNSAAVIETARLMVAVRMGKTFGIDPLKVRRGAANCAFLCMASPTNVSERIPASILSCSQLSVGDYKTRKRFACVECGFGLVKRFAMSPRIQSRNLKIILE